jgi:proteasome lid subunit RPN8/RPN11
MFGMAVEAKAKLHALREYPKESCGVVIDGKYVEMENIHPEPEKAFRIEGFPRGLQAVIHSHPYVRPETREEHVKEALRMASPSADDMAHQIESAVPWGIVATDGKIVEKVTWFGDECPIAPLKGRTFLYGVRDCYALFRDTFRVERGIKLKEFPRDPDWWYKDQDVMSFENFKELGFVEIDKKDLKPYDGVVGHIRCEKVNHCGLYRGRGLVFHHLYGRLSREEPLGPWDRFIDHYLRYEG